jgi:hypothetical protein
MTYKIEDVASVYSGKRGKCMCGCAGKHRYASAHRAWSEKQRGYSISDDEVSDKSVKIIFNKVLGADFKAEDKYIYAEVGDRSYVVYFKGPTRAELEGLLSKYIAEDDIGNDDRRQFLQNVVDRIILDLRVMRIIPDDYYREEDYYRGETYTK